MIKFRLSCVLALICSMVLVACGEKVVEVASVAISQPSAEMEIGETLSLKATVSPSNASYNDITWTSTKPKVASVSNSGLVSAISEGNTTITVMAGGKTASCSVTVVKGFVAVSTISLNKTSLELIEGDTETLTATVSPDDATEKTVSWTSSNDEVAKVKDGAITAVKEGNAIITAKAGDKTATCSVSVSPKTYPVSSVSLNLSSTELKVGMQLILTATVEPDNATNKNLSWQSSNESIATVKDGVVSAIKEGETTITVTTEDGGKTASCIVIVKDDIIAFEDQYVERVCVSYYDKNGDGKLSMSEAEQVRALKTSFFADYAPIVTSFTELKYFTSVQSIPNSCFEECKRLTSITLPESVTSIGERAFVACISLTKVNNMSDRIRSLGRGAFGECHSLQECYLPNGLTTIRDGLFMNCISLTEIVIPESVTSIEGLAFYGCSSLKEIYIPDSVTNIESGAFLCCVSATSIRISPNIISIKGSTFGKCGARTITIPEGVLNIGGSAFSESSKLEVLSIPSTVVVMAEICSRCESLHTVYCNAETPPALTALPFTEPHQLEEDARISQNLKHIYVPSQSVEAYKSAEFWCQYDALIQAIPE